MGEQAAALTQHSAKSLHVSKHSTDEGAVQLTHAKMKKKNFADHVWTVWQNFCGSKDRHKQEANTT